MIMTRRQTDDKKLIKSLLEKDESFDVEFKKILDAVESEDLVAFANSAGGGFIVIGVAEVKDHLKQSNIEINGTKVGDQERLKILNKAQDCLPPIELSITRHEYEGKNLLVIRIPSGTNRPYCTKKGVYKIRGDGRNQILTQELMFQIFMEKEYNTFIDRFKTATHELKNEITYIQEMVERSEDEITASLHGIFAEAEDAQSTSEDVFSMTESIFTSIDDLQEQLYRQENHTQDLEKKIDLILNHLNIERPEVTRRKFFISSQIKEIIAENKKRKIKQRKKTIIKKILSGTLTKWFDLDETEVSILYDQIVQ